MKEFEVRFPKSDLIWIGLIYLGLIALCILMFVIGKNFRTGVVFSVIVALMFVATVVPNCLFNLRVSNDTFKVRTKLGKSYEFNIKDIKKVECSNHNRPKLGPLYEMIIYTDNNELELNHSMEGFEILADYLLSKYENGEIKNKAISKGSRDLLAKMSEIKKR